MEIEEGNKLIAEFMGAVDSGLGNYLVWPNENKKAYYNELKYHTSWDWLMPVVEKIEQSETTTWVEIYGDRKVFVCSISDENQEVIDGCAQWIVDARSTVSKIKAVYDAVIEFIQWYNQTKQP